MRCHKYQSRWYWRMGCDIVPLECLLYCETFLNSDVPDELITADGFNFEREDREGKSGGGILVNISQLLNNKRRSDLKGEI